VPIAFGEARELMWSRLSCAAGSSGSSRSSLGGFAVDIAGRRAVSEIAMNSSAVPWN
jgi:hypothetical protein